MPRVTVVTPCYNAQRWLGATIRSVREQTLTDWAHVVVDDASTDGSLVMMEAAATVDSRVRIVRQPSNRGAAAARNRGAATARSDYLLFLDADDVLEPAMLGRTVAYLDEHPQVVAVYTGHSYIGPDGADLGPEPGNWPWARCVATRFWVRMLPDDDPVTPFGSIFLVAAIMPSLAVMRTAAFAATSGWDESFGSGCDDTDFFLRLALYGPVHHLAETLVRYRRHPGQSSQRDDFEGQYKKLTAKWLQGYFLCDEERQLVRDAAWFRAHRFYPYRCLAGSLSAARSGSYRSAGRLFLAAAHNYSARRPPRTLYG